MNRRRRSSLRRVAPVLGLALLTLAAFSTAASSAWGANPHWFACQQNWGAENFANSICTEETEEGLGEYGLQRLSEGSSHSVDVTGTSDFAVSWEAFGLPVEIGCTEQTSEGATAENPNEVASGTLEGDLLFGGCTAGGVIAKCNVAPQPLEFDFQATATEVEGEPALKLSPVGSEVLFSFEVNGEKCPLNGAVFEAEHYVVAVQNGSGELDFSETASDLFIGGEPATVDGGAVKVEAGGKRALLSTVSTSPSVTTEAATGVGLHSAVLHATVNPSGSATRYYFVYGTTALLQNKTSEVSVGSGVKAVQVYREIVGLEPNTTYGVRVVAKNAEEVAAIGKEETFTTDAPSNPRWYSCEHNWGVENYADSSCAEETPVAFGEYGLREFTSGSAQEVSVSGVSDFVLNWNESGVPVEVSCTTMADKGATAENPTGGGAGTLETSFHLEGCAVGGVEYCTVSEPIEINLQGEAVVSNEKSAIELGGSGGGPLFSLNMEGGECPLPKVLYFDGSTTGILNSANLFEFTEASSDLEFSGTPATLTGVSKVETPGGQRVMLTP
jgi:hypothetical protein